MGGITIGMMYFLGIAGVTQNSSVYLGAVGYLYVLFGCALTWILFSFFSDFIKGQADQGEDFCRCGDRDGGPFRNHERDGGYGKFSVGSANWEACPDHISVCAEAASA